VARAPDPRRQKTWGAEPGKRILNKLVWRWIHARWELGDVDGKGMDGMITILHVYIINI
jgi:hypothetical protein